MLSFLSVFALEVHAILFTPGLLERCDVCHVRTAEKGHDGSKAQIQHNCTVITTSSQEAYVALWCYL